MSQTINGSQTTVQTLTSAQVTIAAGASVIANGKLGTFSIDNNGSLSPVAVYGAVFAPAALGAVTIHNLGFVEADGSTANGVADGGIVIGGTGTIFNTGTIKGNSGIAIFGTSGADYINNSKLIAGSYGVGMYLAGNAVITNSGTILGTSGTQVNASGIEIRGTAFVSNATTGTIAAAGAGALELDGNGTILNAGLLTGYAGVRIKAGGFVSNASTGTIAGTLLGLGFYGAGTIINAGHIINTGAGTANTYAGISLGNNTSGAVTATISNTGTITGDQYGIDDFGGPAIVTNTGLILSKAAKFTIANNGGTVTGYGTGIELDDGATLINQAGGSIIGDIGVGLVAGGSVSNAGTIIGSGVDGITLGGTGTITNSGFIAGYREAIRDKSASALIINSGTIIATGNTFVIPGATGSAHGFPTGTYISHGIQLTQGGTVINQAGGTIAGQTAIDLKGAGEYVYNAGLVTASGHAGIYLENFGSVKNAGTIHASNPAIELYGGGNVTITNTGLATSSAKSAIYLKQSGTVTNAGIIIGTGPGIQMADGGTVINTGSVTGKAGIAVTLAAGYVLNQKFVDGTSTSGIYLQNGGTINNTGFAEGAVHGIEIFSGTGFAENSGTIIGATGALFGGVGTFADSGTITGTAGAAVSFSSGFANRLIIEPGASFSGAVTGGNAIGGGAISTLEFASAASATTFSGAALNAQFTDFAAIVIDKNANVTFTGATTFANGETLTDYGTLTFTGAVTDAGLIVADPATIIFDTAVTGPGTIDVNAGDTIIFNGSVSSTETIDFLSPQGTIFVNDPSQFNATVIGAGVEIFACFAAGTRILTPRGDIPVENLTEGDMIITTEGDDVPIKWIGRRSLDLTKIKNPEKAQPIRIAAGALADSVPSRDLLLSPDHALYFENHLIPAKALINHRNVTQLQKTKITYYHIELANHTAIFAENTPCETYLETGNRACFENAPVTALHADFNPPALQAEREAKSFAPFTETGAAAERLRRKILASAFNAPSCRRMPASTA